MVGGFINPGQVAANAAPPNSRVLAGALALLRTAPCTGLWERRRAGVQGPPGQWGGQPDHVWAAAKEGAGYGALLGGCWAVALA